ncbi:MAG: RDD family protein [Flavobacteriaceae bacterium CG_4_8_14_3_um_filter_34_10]|nr:RDD family protein [Flavobacteriia bacterium]OIP50186.1 MAG: transporter [Flavobacteriaceae bacterium CG2_30_34_30]PIQ19023.1 MAG: transporter [Flavobacteriaceae bacterium CG18_big_fil_WC_8_21_14_2_50_34_36]PIV49387.1 MAG: RDD family protein [Flavobacteriaceae bacterium CG02_land_8_20_14_3_00_34_13]PIX09736.1 MAG: RDD family protein [Flavobacteriaceae bacterium CG_4_8_14_3_um_filter_34_10]PIZ08796.1 MAG: RDD family protein [Flavobacteriaceae bacterium CG_4_10_14_0_8_um_filter_34_31]PJC0833
MDNFQIETAQNATIFQNIAAISDRILAFILDVLILGLYVILISIFFSEVQIGEDYYFVFVITVGLPIIFYHLLWEVLWNGKSPGKAVMQLRVIKLDGSKPAFSNYLLRWVMRLVDISVTSGALAIVSILLNGKGQRIGDIAAGTTVITEKKTITLSDTVFMELPNEYQPKYPQVLVFKDEEMQTMKSIFVKAKMERNHHIILKLSSKAAKVMEVQFEETPIQFIDTILKDYTFYTQQQ